ncbi:MAG: hypothetical protein M1829_001410 [Trizodia sp. TS-e1964]|nr:MAG: hypothetical protein M1829_001410 [Trizodia sp. TS-e1964]
MTDRRLSRRFSVLPSKTSLNRRASVFGSLLSLNSSSRAKPPPTTLLPPEIIYRIAWFIKVAHTCRTCYLRDLNSLCLSNRTFHYYLTSSIYTAIAIPAPDSRALDAHVAQVIKRLALLHRTLSGAPGLAELVRDLSLPELPSHAWGLENTFGGPDAATLVGLIISLCPLVQRIRGLHSYFPQPMGLFPAFPISHAIYRSPHLREQIWWARSTKLRFLRFGFRLSDFPSYHNAWVRLENLALCGWRARGSVLNPGLSPRHFTAIFAALPSLSQLYLVAFTKGELPGEILGALSRIPLKSLRLEDLEGVQVRDVLIYLHETPLGILSSLRTLALLSLPSAIFGAQDISTLLSLSVNLKRLTIRQNSDRFTLANRYYPLELQPVAWNASLTHLHWEVLPADPANAWLCHCMIQGSFPGLLAVRAPQDVRGEIQATCRPLALAQVQALHHQLVMAGASSAMIPVLTRVAARIVSELQEDTRPRLAHVAFDIDIVDPDMKSFLLEEEWLERVKMGNKEEEVTEEVLQSRLGAGAWCDSSERATEALVRRATTGSILTSRKRKSTWGLSLGLGGLNLGWGAGVTTAHAPRRRDLWDEPVGFDAFFR